MNIFKDVKFYVVLLVVGIFVLILTSAKPVEKKNIFFICNSLEQVKDLSEKYLAMDYKIISITPESLTAVEVLKNVNDGNYNNRQCVSNTKIIKGRYLVIFQK